MSELTPREATQRVMEICLSSIEEYGSDPRDIGATAQAAVDAARLLHEMNQAEGGAQ